MAVQVQQPHAWLRCRVTCVCVRPPRFTHLLCERSRSVFKFNFSSSQRFAQTTKPFAMFIRFLFLILSRQDGNRWRAFETCLSACFRYYTETHTQCDTGACVNRGDVCVCVCVWLPESRRYEQSEGADGVVCVRAPDKFNSFAQREARCEPPQQQQQLYELRLR